MNKADAKKMIAEDGLTWGDIKGVLKRAFEAGFVATKRSKTNKGLSKGTVFNIFRKGIQLKPDDKLVSNDRVGFVGVNILWEFGEAAGIKAPPRYRRKLPPICHQEPTMGDDPESKGDTNVDS